MEIKEAQNYITTEKIGLSEFFGGEDVFITIREPSKHELLKLSKSYKSDDDTAEIMGELLPDLIIDHNFTNNGKKVDSKKVVDIIESITKCWSYVYEQFYKVLPITDETEDGKKK